MKLQTNRDKDGQNFSKLVMLTSRSKKGNFFKEIIHVGQVAEMVRLGFWSPLQYETTGFDSSLLVFNSSKSEYTEESVHRAYDANGGSEQIVQALGGMWNPVRSPAICSSKTRCATLSWPLLPYMSSTNIRIG